MTKPLQESLRELADASRSLEPESGVEERVMAAFDATRGRQDRRPARAWRTLAAAAVLVLAGSAIWLSDRRPASHGSPEPIRSEFVAWPGAATLPSFESGELVRVDLPVAVLPSLGLAPPATRGIAVKADVIVGQDGYARAVRLVE